MTNNKKDNKTYTDNELYYLKVCEENRKQELAADTS